MNDKIDDYNRMMDERASFEVRMQQWEDAVHHPVVDYVCPHCGSELWDEEGYWSLYEQLIFEGFYYLNRMPVSHYRD